ncbi:hypothetical protein ACJMK2_001118, partial [Sinanodonta woodiana]
MSEYCSLINGWSMSVTMHNSYYRVFFHSIAAPEINVAEHVREMVDKEREHPV